MKQGLVFKVIEAIGLGFDKEIIEVARRETAYANRIEISLQKFIKEFLSDGINILEMPYFRGEKSSEAQLKMPEWLNSEINQEYDLMNGKFTKRQKKIASIYLANDVEECKRNVAFSLFIAGDLYSENQMVLCFCRCRSDRIGWNLFGFPINSNDRGNCRT